MTWIGLDDALARTLRWHRLAHGKSFANPAAP